MAKLLNRLSKSLHQATQQLLDMFAIYTDDKDAPESEIGDTDD